MNITKEQKHAIIDATELDAPCEYRITVNFDLDSVTYFVSRADTLLGSIRVRDTASAVPMALAMRDFVRRATASTDPFADCERIAEEATTL